MRCGRSSLVQVGLRNFFKLYFRTLYCCPIIHLAASEEHHSDCIERRSHYNMATEPPLSKATGYGIVVGLGFLFA